LLCSFPWFYRWILYYQLLNLRSTIVTSLETVRRCRRYSKTNMTYFLLFEPASWSFHWRFRGLRTHFWTHPKYCWISHMILKSDIISRKTKRCLFRRRNWYLECLFWTWLSWWFTFFRARWLSKCWSEDSRYLNLYELVWNQRHRARSVRLLLSQIQNGEIPLFFLKYNVFDNCFLSLL